MAADASKIPSGSGPPTFAEMFRYTPWLFLDGLVLMAAVIIGGAVFYFFPGARENVWQALGYGWIPAGLWIFSAIFFLRYHPPLLARYWRRWAATAAAIALTLGAMSYAYPSRGLLEDVSYAGRWGMAIGGPSLFPLGVAKMAGILAFVPLVLYPRSVGPLYKRWLAGAWRGFQLAAGYAYLGIRWAISGIGDGLGRLNDRMVHARQARQEAKANRAQDVQDKDPGRHSKSPPTPGRNTGPTSPTC